MPALNAMATACRLGGKYYGRARFLVVYIAEAHAGDEWPIGWHYEPLQHRTDRERIDQAILFQRDFGLHADVAVAPVNSVFESEYRPWPFRFFGIRMGRIELSPKPIDGMEIYDIVEIWNYLDTL